MAPDPVEQAELSAERERLRHAEGLREAASGALAGAAGADEDGGGAASALAGARRSCRVSGASTPISMPWPSAWRPQRSSWATSPRNCVATSIGSRPIRVASPRSRSASEAIDRLQRKHGGSVESVLAHAERCRAEIERLEGAETRGGEAQAALAGGRSAAREARQAAEQRPGSCRATLAGASRRGARATGDARCRAGGRADAALRGVRGKRPRVGRAADLAQSRHGRRAAARRRIRRGALAGDAGPQRVGEAMARVRWSSTRSTPASAAGPAVSSGTPAALGEAHQVLCVTHLPQVASLAPTHFRLEKNLNGERATANVRRLDGEGVVEEIRRMLGGESADEAADRHARELLAAA